MIQKREMKKKVKQDNEIELKNRMIRKCRHANLAAQI